MDSEVTKILKNNVEYKILPYQFFLLTFWGIWSPNNWSLKQIVIHKVYFRIIIFLDTIISIEMLIHFILSLSSEDFKITNFFFVTANITGVYKAFRMMQTREQLRYLIKSYFDSNWMNSLDSGEDEIHEKINIRIKRVIITYSASMIGIVFLKAMSPLAEYGVVIQLPVDAWYPYSIENPYWFWITYLHQVILGTSAVSAHIGVDTLFVGLLLKGLGQIEVLKHRMKNMIMLFNEEIMKYKSFKSLEKKMIFQCISHHKRIYRFGEDLNSQFQELLIILVVSSLPNICINIYALSAYKDEVNVQYIATIFCTTSALLQFFIACWFGNEVSLNSVQVRNSVYDMDWTEFDVPTQKLLILIMARSLKPIKFSVGYLMPMNLNSFIMIIKASYTAFNLLQQTSD